MSKIDSAVEDLVAWSRASGDVPLSPGGLGLLDIAATGLADLGIPLPAPLDAPDGAWMAGFFAAVSKAGSLVEEAAASSRTRLMTRVAREQGAYHAEGVARIIGGLEHAAAAWSGPGRAAMRTSFAEFIAHLGHGFALHGRAPHCGAAGRALLPGAVAFEGPGRFEPSMPPYRYVGDETAIINLHFGQPMFVDLADDSVCPEIIQTGWWEPWIDGVLQKCVGRGDVAVNVGANLGYHVLLLANGVQDSGKVFAYEPNPRLLRRLARSVKWGGLRQTTMILPFAAADAIGRMKITFTPEMSGHGGFFETSDAVWRPHVDGGNMAASSARAVEAVIAPRATTTEVDVTTLDATVGNLVDSIHVLLIDAEQAEPLILEGGMDLIRRSRDLTIVMEWMNGPTIAPSPEMRARGVKIVERLAAEGFRFWNIDCDRSDIFARPAVLDPLTVEQVLAIDGKADLFLRRR